MARAIREILVAGAVLLAGCLAPSGGADTSAKTAKTDAKTEPAEPVVAPEPEPEGNDGFSSLERTPPGPLPGWFSVDAFEHVKVIRQDERANELPTGQSATMIVLELPPGTTPEQCLDRAKAKLGESIPHLAEPTTTPQGYLTLKGQTGTYEFTIVCGIAKETPTMFLSVVQ